MDTDVISGLTLLSITQVPKDILHRLFLPSRFRRVVARRTLQLEIWVVLRMMGFLSSKIMNGIQP
jgi:hypothetical protein